MVAGAKKSEAPPNSRASGVQGMEANRTPSQSIKQTDANGAPIAVFVKQFQPKTRLPRQYVNIPCHKVFKRSWL